MASAKHLIKISSTTGSRGDLDGGILRLENRLDAMAGITWKSGAINARDPDMFYLGLVSSEEGFDAASFLDECRTSFNQAAAISYVDPRDPEFRSITYMF